MAHSGSSAPRIDAACHYLGGRRNSLEARAKKPRYFHRGLKITFFSTSGGKRFHKVLAEPSLDRVRANYDWRGQVRLDDILHLRIELFLISLGVRFSCPEADGN